LRRADLAANGTIGRLAAACNDVLRQSRRGKFLVKRKTRRDRMRSNLAEIKEALRLRRRMHQPIPVQGKWLRQVVDGYFNSFAVPTNHRALTMFRDEVVRRCGRLLGRRSDKGVLTWARINALGAEWLPQTTRHKWPNQRFAVRYPRWEAYAGKLHVRFYAGAAR
jgi:hypothetical protein